MPKFAANLSMMFNEVPFLDRFAAAAECGFRAVEYLFPYDHPAEVVAERLQKAGLAQALFNMPSGNWTAGERGMAALAGLVMLQPPSIPLMLGSATAATAATREAVARRWQRPSSPTPSCQSGRPPPSKPRSAPTSASAAPTQPSSSKISRNDPPHPRSRLRDPSG